MRRPQNFHELDDAVYVGVRYSGRTAAHKPARETHKTEQENQHWTPLIFVHTEE